MRIRLNSAAGFATLLVLFANAAIAQDHADKESGLNAETTRGIIDFERPVDAVQLVGEAGSIMIPESDVECQWTFQDGVLTASPKWDSVVTPEAFQDFQLHVEFNINDAGDVPRERDGNSGIYLQQRYELQILNSFGVSGEDYKNDDCGCIYGLKKPDQFVCKPPLEWQSFDIAFRAARFDGEERIQKARVTVYHNQVLIHDDFPLDRKTGAGLKEDSSPRPVKFQGHHNQVQFRNVWIQKLSLPDGQVPEISRSDKSLPVPGEAFEFNGKEAFIILPAKVAPDQPWVWYAPTLPGLPGIEEQWMFQRFLDAGIAIAGIDVGESYGSPAGCTSYSEFYDYLVNTKKFGGRPVLLARSRGGLMLYSWAVQNPKSVAGIAGIYPVCNIASYPGIERACGAYELSAEELEADLKKYNPIDRLEPLAKENVPIFHIHGDQDNVVPLPANSGILAERYKAMGGDITLEVVQGQGHNMWTGWFQSERLVEFVLAHARQEPGVAPVPESELWLTYAGGEGPGKGKHIVLIAADQEYRSEQTMPMLARILSHRHGFDCTVLFSVNDQGEVDPTLPAPFKDETKRHNIPGLECLNRADCVIWLSRFMQLPDEQIQHFHDYFDSGKPIIALRTANHGFLGGKPYTKEGKNVSLRELLGGSFMDHHGGWHRESTRGVVVEAKRLHPILTGVNDIWGTSDVYRCHDENSPVPKDCRVIVLGQPLLDLTPESAPNNEKEPLPIAWTKTWVGNRRLPTKIFHFTMGSARDFENEGVRRITINAVYWGLGMEEAISEDNPVDVVGDYYPLASGFNYEGLGVQPHKPAFYKGKE